MDPEIILSTNATGEYEADEDHFCSFRGPIIREGPGKV
jgi:hypothetical protein